MSAIGLSAGLAFAPALPWWAWGALAALTVAALGFAARRRARGTVWRAAALAVTLFWLAGPTLVAERRTPLADVALLVVDQTPSMRVGDRPALAAQAQAALQAQAAKVPGLELRTVTVPPGSDGTELFGAIGRALSGVPRDRLSAVLAITDGQIHDIPASAAGLPPVPLHVLLAGHGEETDRRLRLIEAPGYGVVGKSVTLRLAVDDLGAHDDGTQATITIRRDGEPPRSQEVSVGEPAAVELPVTHEGPSVVELTVNPRPGEVSDLNNRAVVQVTGVRDRLRVLLVSGEPHAGERAWRRLLKSDPAVDLVHFTILRPPEKDDLTPLNELALIAFPTRELFQQKVHEFDLIILDRFQNRGILPLPYLRNIAEYVRDGGGLLVSVGPEFATAASLDQTPLRAVLPAHPVAKPGDPAGDDEAGVVEPAVTGPFQPAVTAVGTRHPVTENLPGWHPPDAIGPGRSDWGHWYRRLPAEGLHGQVLLNAGAGDAAPLLLLDRVGRGRVALLLSDQIWLWSRGHDGGGPEAELLRRIAHWLMKQPELEENALEARIGADGKLAVERRSTADGPAPDVTVTDPAGGRQTVRLMPGSGGTAAASLPAAMPGVWQASDGEHTAYAAASAGDPREMADLRATAERVGPLATATGGGVHWLGSALPELRRVQAGRVASGRDWVGLPARGAHVTTSIDSVVLIPDWLALTLLLGSIVIAWWRESR